MIIGNGLIANAFKESNLNHDKYIIFASGVSNSNETDDNEFRREEQLLVSNIIKNSNKKLIYFTSILSETKSNKYYIHKNRMEKIIQYSKIDYIIYRIPQLLGKIGNKSNLIHFLKNSIQNNKEIIIYNGIDRAIIDVVDLIKMVDYSIDKINRDYVNISYIEKLSVVDLVHLISTIIRNSSIYKLVDGKGINWFSENSLIIKEWILINNIKIKGYTEITLRKYI